MSEGNGTISKAFIAAQSEFPAITKDLENPHFRSRYSSLEAIITTVLPILKNHGLALSQSFEPSDTPESFMIVTTIIHESGETMQGRLLMPIGNKATPQSVGSAITYARRYAICALLCLATEDDDGNAAQPKPQQQQQSTPRQQPTQSQPTQQQQPQRQSAPSSEPVEVDPGIFEKEYVVEKMTAKTGAKADGTPWTKYSAKTTCGEWLSTFSEAQSKPLYESEKTGDPVVIRFKVNGDYKNIDQVIACSPRTEEVAGDDGGECDKDVLIASIEEKDDHGQIVTVAVAEDGSRYWTKDSYLSNIIRDAHTKSYAATIYYVSGPRGKEIKRFDEVPF